MIGLLAWLPGVLVAWFVLLLSWLVDTVGLLFVGLDGYVVDLLVWLPGWLAG
jgi:hypothetical protein